MRARAGLNSLTRRVQRLQFRAETFGDERILAAIVDAVEHGDNVVLMRFTKEGAECRHFEFKNCRAG